MNISGSLIANKYPNWVKFDFCAGWFQFVF
jgi:hypothetical protein